jgi:hypothetical protein
MMLQIGHRESHDVDIFLSDPQYLGLLNPDKNDFTFEVLPTEYNGDGAGFLKLAFENIGEIDFIVGHAMTDRPTRRQTIEGTEVLLETIPEIITKKIYYRGASIKPRDIFDVAAGAEKHQDEIIGALKAYRPEATRALETLSNRSFAGPLQSAYRSKNGSASRQDFAQPGRTGITLRNRFRRNETEYSL